MLQEHPSEILAFQRERLLRLLAAVTFLIFFQAYMVAPMIPRLSVVFGVSPQTIALIVPAYLIPYGVSTLFYGLLSDWIGRKRIMFTSLFAFVLLTAFTATAHSASQLLVWRMATGLGASGVVPLALYLAGILFRASVRIGGDWYWAGTTWLRGTWIPAWSADWARGGPMGKKVANSDWRGDSLIFCWRVDTTIAFVASRSGRNHSVLGIRHDPAAVCWNCDLA